MQIKRYSLLEFIPEKIYVEKELNHNRIFELNNKPIYDGHIIYICHRAIRAKDNFALQFVLQKSKELNLPIKIIHPLKKYEYEPKNEFIKRQIESFQNSFPNFFILENSYQKFLQETKISFIVTDFNPLESTAFFRDFPFKVYEIDGHNLIPARYISDKQEYAAVTIRKKIYLEISNFLTEFDNDFFIKTEADYMLDYFIKNRLPFYEKFKNDPSKNVLSGLSRYINLGFISCQRIALEIIKSNVSENNKEAFLEELVVRKELAENFCLYCNEFKSYKCIPDWAKKSLNIHKNDLREYQYTQKELELGKTHDQLWNATQHQLIKEGSIHSYLRMYWAKKIMEWSINAESALKTAIYINDKYSYDSPSPNGYTGILWALGGLHDRPFMDWKVTGKIRRMTYNSLKRKYNLKQYIDLYNEI